MDEPLGALDKNLREDLQLEIKRIQREVGVSVIYVTHDQSEALTMSDRIAIMRGGRLEQYGPAEELYERPATRFVAEFVGEATLAEGRVESARDGDVIIVLDDGRTRFVTRRAALSHRAAGDGGGAAREGVPRERGGGHAQHVPAVVTDAMYLGDTTKYWVKTEQGTAFVIKSQSRSGTPRSTKGDPVYVGIDERDVIVVSS